MLFDFPSIAYEAKADLAAAGIRLRHSHVLEICAALCGYGSHSAFASTGRAQALGDAEHVVLDLAYAQTRAAQLGISATEVPTTVSVVAERIQQSLQSFDLQRVPRIHFGIEGFRDGYLFEHIQATVLNSEQMSSTIAETNASDFDVYSDEVMWNEGIRTARGFWTVVAEGTFAGEQDEDRVYHGHEGDFAVRIDYDKIDRVGLREVDVQVTAGLVDRYQDE